MDDIKGQPTFEVMLNADYLNRIAAYLTQGSNSSGIKLSFYGERKPVKITNEKISPDSIGVIMPLSHL